MNFILSTQDILFAAFISLILTILVLGVMRMVRLFNAIRKIDYESDSEELDFIMQSCYRMFPDASMDYGEKTLKRGCIVRVTTHSNQVFEGRFVGKNKENVICILTRKNIVAHQLADTADITVLFE